MNEKDLKRLEDLDKRYGSVNRTAFRIVNANVTKGTVLKHIKTDLEVFNSSDVENKHIYRVIIEDDIIDICSNDNGTPVSYFFTEDARFTPMSIKDEVEKLCSQSGVVFQIL